MALVHESHEIPSIDFCIRWWVGGREGGLNIVEWMH